MKKLLALISIAGLLCAIPGCREGGNDITPALDEELTTPPQFTEPEMTSPDYTALREQFEKDLEIFEYEKEDCYLNVGNENDVIEKKYAFTRYSKIVNGLISNDNYDIFPDGSIIKSLNTITLDDIAEARQHKLIESDFKPEESFFAGGGGETKLEYKLREFTEDTFYIKIGDKVLPIRYIYAFYEADRPNSEDLPEFSRKIYNQKSFAINLLDGSFVEPDEITFE